MAWVVGLVWGIAGVFGIAVLGLLAWDLAGKVRRLRTAAESLVTLRERLSDVQVQVADAQRRVPSLPSVAGR